jgi:hypothetical protein
MAWPAALLANAVIGGLILGFGWIEARDADLYYRSLQEDEALEWSTFWGFLAAGGLFGVAALRQHRAGEAFPWFASGLALFCIVVAMEEISWGQRVLGYRPPAYFLEHNFQQELNLHNVMSTTLRKLALKAVILGYGVVLPLLALAPALRRGLHRLGVREPPLLLAPAFLATFGLYQTYPWRFSGEIVEAILALGFLFAALAMLGLLRFGGRPALGLGVVAAAVLGVGLLGSAHAAASRWERGSSPEALRTAEREVQALRRDFLAIGKDHRDGLHSRCGLHRRVYTYVQREGGGALERGEFADLVVSGLPEERAAFFLDPWNSPYWIRDRCRDGGRERVAFVYSFGPNRRRESSPWEIRGDDVGEIIFLRR